MHIMSVPKYIKSYVDALMKRPAAERAAVAEALLRSLDDSEIDLGWDASFDPRLAINPGADADAASGPALSHAWAAEIQRRIAESLPGIPASIVFSEGRARLKKLRPLPS